MIFRSLLREVPRPLVRFMDDADMYEQQVLYAVAANMAVAQEFARLRALFEREPTLEELERALDWFIVVGMLASLALSMWIGWNA